MGGSTPPSWPMENNLEQLRSQLNLVLEEDITSKEKVERIVAGLFYPLYQNLSEVISILEERLAFQARIPAAILLAIYCANRHKTLSSESSNSYESVRHARAYARLSEIASVLGTLTERNLSEEDIFKSEYDNPETVLQLNPN